MDAFNILSAKFAFPCPHIITDCDVAHGGTITAESLAMCRLRAIWDTGAAITTIHESILLEINANKIDNIPVNTMSGVVQSGLYKIDLILPFGAAIPNLTVIAGWQSKCDVLIGMDVIGRGNFAVSYNPDTNQVEMAFRMPSGGVINLSNSDTFN